MEVWEYKRGPYYYNRSDNRKHMVTRYTEIEDDETGESETVVYEDLKTFKDKTIVRNFKFWCKLNGEREFVGGWEVYGDTMYKYDVACGMIQCINE